MWFVARMARTGRPCLLEQRSLSRLISWWQLFQLATVECFRHHARPEIGFLNPIYRKIYIIRQILQHSCLISAYISFFELITPS
jgi:hypothetical protein